MLNWRDPWHPKAGGAEHLTLRILERLVPRDWVVEWFSAAYTGAPLEETRNGIRFVRRGTALSVHWEAFRRYRKTCEFDVVVDQINTIPFFSPLYIKKTRIANIQQLARDVWFYEAPFPLSLIGYISEPMYLQVYRSSPVVTISASSASSLRVLGFRGSITVIPMAVDELSQAVVPPKKNPRSIVVIGRVTPSKRIPHALHAAAMLAERGWDGTLSIVGSGLPSYVNRLREIARELRIEDRIVFHGRVTNERRSELLAEASLLWMCSVREGWGLVVTESARNGTPAVVYDVPGLRDSVVTEQTGLVVPATPRALCEGTERVFKEFDRFAAAALSESSKLSWEKTASAFERALIEAMGPKNI